MVPPALPLLFASFFVLPAYRSPLPQELVQPWTYRSPSGAVELFVDPTERHGSGPASYRMTRDGAQVWARTIPFTFLDVLLLDDGSAAGYAHSEGVQGLGELIVAALDSDGSERWVKREPRVSRRPCSREPTAYELRPCLDGFAVWVFLGSKDGDWWTFDWSTGRSLEQGGSRLLELIPALSSTVELPIPPSIELSFVGRVEFPWPVALVDGPRERRPHKVYVDWQDRIWISEFSTRVIHGFDQAGHPLLELTPDPKTFRPYRPCEWMSLRGDGHLFTCGDQGVEEFGPSREQVGWTPLKEILPPRWLFLPGRNERWVVHSIGPIELLGEGQGPLTIERGANGRWFQDFLDASVARDGSLAVLDEPNPGVSSRDPSPWVHLFDRSGEARRSLRIRDEFNGYHTALAFDGRRIALLHGGLLLLLEEDGSPIGQMVLPVELGEPYYLFFSPDGRELWVFSHTRPEMFRFALPE